MTSSRARAGERVAAGHDAREPRDRGLAEARERVVVAGVVDALARVPTYEAVALLARVARDEQVPQVVRVSAAEGFGTHAEQALPDEVRTMSGVMLWELAADRDLRTPVRAAAQKMLLQHYPQVVAQRRREQRVLAADDDRGGGRHRFEGLEGEGSHESWREASHGAHAGREYADAVGRRDLKVASTRAALAPACTF